MGYLRFLVNKKARLILLFLAIAQITNGQDIIDVAHYTIYKPIINPAASSEYEYFAGMAYGSRQWNSIEGAPENLGMHFIQPWRRSAIGALISQESIGVHKRQMLMLSYAYRVKIDKKRSLSFGMTGGGEFISSNFTDVYTTNEFDKEFMESKTALLPDFSFGMSFFTTSYYIGLSIPSLMQNTISSFEGELQGASKFAPLKWYYYLNVGYIYEVNRNYKIHFSSLAKIALETPSKFDFNIQISYKEAFGGGISYRTSHEALFFANFNIRPDLKIGYCYHSYFGINKQMLSGHELAIIYTLIKSKPATIQSPRF